MRATLERQMKENVVEREIKRADSVVEGDAIVREDKRSDFMVSSIDSSC